MMFLVSMLCTGCYVKQMKSIHFFNPSSVTQMRAQVNCNTIAYICWLIQTFKYQCCGCEVHFKSILVYDLKTKRDFWPTYPHYIMGYIVNLGSMFFLFSLVLNLAYIDYSLYQIWSVYMQYLLCFDHSNKCLFLVIQQAEVLLNFFGGVYMQHWRRWVNYIVITGGIIHWHWYVILTNSHNWLHPSEVFILETELSFW